MSKIYFANLHEMKTQKNRRHELPEFLVTFISVQHPKLLQVSFIEITETGCLFMSSGAHEKRQAELIILVIVSWFLLTIILFYALVPPVILEYGWLFGKGHPL